MQSALFLNISLVFYLAAAILYVIYAFSKKEAVGKIATLVFSIGILMNTITLIQRGIEVRRAPLVKMYETLILWSWLMAVIYLILQFRFRIKALGALVAPLVFLAIAFAPFLPEILKDTDPVQAILQSHWREFHISTCFIAYACFAISFAVGLAYLFKPQRDNPDAGLSKEKLDMIGYRIISVGFPFLTIGIISGSIWGSVAWGRYWGWDPKEVCSLITWFVYVIYLHLRIVAKWKGKASAIVSVVGFIAVLFTFFGVSFLLKGLHSYVD